MKKALAILFIAWLALYCGGCWDRKELKTLAIIAGVGVDRTPDGKFITTFQIIRPAQVKSNNSGNQGAGGGMAQAFFVTSAKSVTNFGSARLSQFWLSRNFYLPPSQVLVFGRETARQSIRKAYDLHARYPQKRFTEIVAVAKGTAEEILKAQNQVDKISAIALASTINYSSRWTGKVVATNSIELFQYLISKTRAAVIPQVEITTAVEGEKIVRMSGTAVIKKDRMVGELNGNETRGLLWVLGKVNRALVEIADKSGQGFASLEVTKASGKFQSEIRDKKVIIKISVDTQANVTDLLVNENWSTPDKMRKLGKMGSAIIRQEILASWRKARRLNADIYGFGEAVGRKHPKEWEKMEPEWDRIFPQIKLVVKVETNVNNAGELIKPPLPE